MMMMKLFPLFLLLSFLSSSTCVTAQGTLASRVTQFMIQENALAAETLVDRDTYQFAALEDVRNNLPDDATTTDLQLRSYFALACIYRATFQKTNPRTEAIIPGATLPEWTNANHWINNPNYCIWEGITCDAEANVVEIFLPENNLYGSWPNEVVLLKNTLRKLELFGNTFLYSEDPKWLLEMVALEFLYFGSTAWTHDGIPIYLNGCINLIELDMSKTLWSQGPVRGAAFRSLSKLEYLDMGDNVFTIASGQTGIPAELTALQSLEQVYLDNVQFDGADQLTLDFMTSFELIVELWMDFTKFDATIPTQIGLLSTLASFSCTYCELKGTIPTEIGNTNMNFLWLYANELEGNIPAELSNLSNMRFLFVESNNLAGAVPAEICNNNVNLEEFGADCTVDCECCTCCGETCGNLEDPTPAPTVAPETAAPTPAPLTGICFSGDSLVRVQEEGSSLRKMSDLVLGDMVQVMSPDGGDAYYEPIYSFGHKSANERAEYLSIHAGSYTLEVSSLHMVAVGNNNNNNNMFVPAHKIQQGDLLLVSTAGTTTTVAVDKIQTVMRKGAYAPFTPSGTIVVNDIVASNYVAYDDNMSMIDYHTLAHWFNSVHRMAYRMGLEKEQYTAEGTSYWVATPHAMALKMMEQHVLLQGVLLAAFVAIFGTMVLLETAMMQQPVGLLLLLGGAFVLVVLLRHYRVVAIHKKKTKIA